MIIGACTIELSLPGVNSLKGKRKVVRSVLDKLRARFNVAAAEVDALDVHRRAILGLAVVSNDGRHANSMIDTLVSFVANTADAVVVGHRLEIVRAAEGGYLDPIGLELRDPPGGDWDGEG